MFKCNNFTNNFDKKYLVKVICKCRLFGMNWYGWTYKIEKSIKIKVEKSCEVRNEVKLGEGDRI